MESSSSSSEQTVINRRPKSANPNRRAASYRVTESRHRTSSTDQTYQSQHSIDECPARPTTPEKSTPAIPPPSYEHLQKASALRVLQKTIQRERDVVHQSTTNSSPSAEPGDAIPEQQLFRKATPPPRKLRPLGREYSGPF